MYNPSVAPDPDTIKKSPLPNTGDSLPVNAAVWICMNGAMLRALAV
jgi:hypothetical protein